MISLRIISCLMDYPTADLWQHRDELIEELNNANELTLKQTVTLCVYINEQLQGDVLDAQARYSELFDRGRATSLLLFEHVYGESRERGQAMVSLLDQYKQAGMQIDCKELPDYLPVYLEYLSTLPQQESCSGLADIAPILALIGERLKQRSSHYHQLFELLLALANSKITLEQLTGQVEKEARDDTPAALDAVWEEEQVTFMADKGCENDLLAKHQQRFSEAVIPQYINLDDSAARGINK